MTCLCTSFKFQMGVLVSSEQINPNLKNRILLVVDSYFKTV